MKRLTKKMILALSLIGILVSGADCSEVNLKSCTACHGVNFEKKALGKSKIVKDMNVTQITTALKGYKDGTYGGPMKGLMKGQIIRYSDTELNDISATIGAKYK